MPARQDAKVVILKSTEQRILEFQRCAARLRARGNMVKTGDTLIAFQVHATVPEGPVMVTDATQFVFSG